jgi:tight adherence protein B
MVLLSLVFIGLLLLTFTVVMITTRSSAADRTVKIRVADIQGPARVMFSGHGVAELFKPTQLSEVDWLNRFLQRGDMFRNIKRLAAQAQSSWSVPLVLGISGGCGISGFAISCFLLPEMTAAIAVGATSLSLPFLYLKLLRARRLKRFNQALPDALDLMTRALRAGHSISAAIEIVGLEAAEPVRGEFREVYRQQKFGSPLRDSLRALADRVPSHDLHFAITALLVQKETGGDLVDTLDRTAAVVRDRIRIQGDVQTHTAQGRLTGWILEGLPIVMFFLINAANHNYARLLVEDPVGRKLLYAGAGAMLLGILLIRKIVNIKV